MEILNLLVKKGAPSSSSSRDEIFFRQGQEKLTKHTGRIFVFLFSLGLVVLLFWGRLFQLQIIFGNQNRQIADENRIKKIISPAPRGIIFDRYQRPLTRNIPVYRIKKDENFEFVDREQALMFEAEEDWQQETLRTDMGREYLYGPVLAHVLGFLNEAGPREIAEDFCQLADLVGRTGIEQQYERHLRGVNGGEIFEVDSLGKKIRSVGQIEPVSGEDLQLTIDAELSKTAFEALKEIGEDKPGVVVVTEVRTGQILALVSYPSFGPNQISQKDLDDPAQPFFNRAISGVYPPGSTFKIVTSAAGLEEGRVSQNTIYEDKGFIKIGDYLYYNWLYTKRGRAEGEIDLVYAIKRSTDTFFYKVGEWVGVRRLADWARAFGFGQPTEIDLPNEAGGLVPDPDWKEKNLGEAWFLGNTYHFAIGQGDLLVTPLQLNMMMSVIANNGRLCRPQVVARNTSEVSRHLRGESMCQDLQLKPETLQLIQEGLKQACSTGGTAWPLFDFSPEVACKTGTAEVGGDSDETHAWLTAYAPFDDPEIVVTAMVERAGEGSDIATPIVKKVLEHYFQ